MSDNTGLFGERFERTTKGLVEAIRARPPGLPRDPGGTIPDGLQMVPSSTAPPPEAPTIGCTDCLALERRVEELERVVLRRRPDREERQAERQRVSQGL